MRLKSFKIGKSKEKPDNDTTEAVDALTTQVDVLEEQFNNKTEELEVTAQELKELSNTANDSEDEEEDTPPQPHGPLSELSVGPEDDLIDEETDIDAPLGEADEEIKVVKVDAGAAAPSEVVEVEAVAAAPPAEASQESPKVEASDSLDNLFNQDEEEENPLATLINALPEVTAQELLDDLQEINEIIREWQQH